MPTTWVYRYYAWIDAALQPATNLTCTGIGPEGAGERFTFTVPLSPTGAAPATHFGAICEATAGLVTKLQTALAAGQLPGVTYYRVDAFTGILLATSSPTAGILGTAWSWARSLADGGLQLVPAAGLPQ